MNAGAESAAGDVLLFLHAEHAAAATLPIILSSTGSHGPDRVWGRFDVGAANGGIGCSSAACGFS